MSITNDADAANEQPKQPQQPQQVPSRSVLAECVNTLIRTVGFSYGKQLSDHAHIKLHEDVPTDAVKTVEEAAAIEASKFGVAQLGVTTLVDRCPERLRSFLPPSNFGAVVPGQVYRSSYPKEENYEFLKSLKLKTILTLVPEDIPSSYRNFMLENGIQHFQVHLPANKGGIQVSSCQMSKALGVVLDRTNHPVLIHCNKGKHRTGCVVGCFRKIQGEYLESIFHEYHTYADPKARILDECFIELFDDRTVLWMARCHGWIMPNADGAPLSPDVPALSMARPRA